MNNRDSRAYKNHRAMAVKKSVNSDEILCSPRIIPILRSCMGAVNVKKACTNPMSVFDAPRVKRNAGAMVINVVNGIPKPQKNSKKKIAVTFLR